MEERVPVDRASADTDRPQEAALQASRLERIRGHLDRSDAETIDFWREASPAAHAEAMMELSDYAQEMAIVTGLGKPVDDMFPGFGPQLPRYGIRKG